jgi:hypothetical protein
MLLHIQGVCLLLLAGCLCQHIFVFCFSTTLSAICCFMLLQIQGVCLLLLAGCLCQHIFVFCYLLLMLLQIQGICLLLLEGCLCHQICLFLLLVAIFVVYATNHQGVCLLQLAESEDGAPHVQSIHEGYDLICFLPFELRSAAALIQLRVLLKMVFQQQNGTLRLESEFTFFPVFIVNFPLLVAAANRVARCQFAFQLRFF